ncbi:MAG: hypothetical protein K0V04_34285 [Deltaproteobacteria bacterium]|nr:hypothetical protein [Deltaproteobacteria bacterium]
MALALGGLSLGCGDDAAPGGNGGTGTGTSTGATGDDTATSMTPNDSGSSAGSGNMEGSESSSSSGDPPPVEVTIEGQVVDFVSMAAGIGDAEISVYDMPGLTDTADNEGMFSVGPFDADTQATFLVAPSENYLGAVIPVAVEDEPTQDGQQLAQIQRLFVEGQIMALEPQMPAMADLTEGIVIVRLLNNTAVMEGPTTVTMDPAPDPGTFYGPDANGAPVLDQTTIEFAALPVLVYFNVPEANPGEISFMATHPTRICEVLFPDFPVLGEHITLVDITCVPPE